MVLLSACATKNCNKRIPILNLPELPIAGELVATELEVVCTKDKCRYLVDYFNKLYLFNVQYNIYRDELK